jgi:hypothetical protein
VNTYTIGFIVEMPQSVKYVLNGDLIATNVVGIVREVMSISVNTKPFKINKI